jgi:hypothetical protein
MLVILQIKQTQIKISVSSNYIQIGPYFGHCSLRTDGRTGRET